MANRRMINKDDSASLSYNQLSVFQRHLFDHIMLEADDDGILPVALIKSRVFPLDDEVTTAMISENLMTLEDLGFIQIYGNPPSHYLHVLDWWKRQNIRADIYKSTQYPHPPGYKPRPKKLDKSSTKSSQTTSSKGTSDVTTEQNSVGERSSQKITLAEAKGEELLPFERDGRINPLYK